MTAAMTHSTPVLRHTCGSTRPAAIWARKPGPQRLQARAQHKAEAAPVSCPTRAVQDLLMTAALVQPGLAWAQEEKLASPLDNPIVEDSISQSISKPQSSFGGYVVLFSPILVYGAFSLYREKINPKAKISNLLYVIAGAAVVANVFSIFVFRIRLF